MAFVYWCFDKAAHNLGLENPLKKTGGVLAEWANTKEDHRITNLSFGQPGDIFIMDFGKGLGHTGIIESVNADGSFNTIEGNTNNNGSREGIAVERKIRKPGKPIIGLIRV
jgi:hypothetical protein